MHRRQMPWRRWLAEPAVNHRGAHLAGGSHAAHVHVALDDVVGGLGRERRVAVRAGECYVVPQLLYRDGRLGAHAVKLSLFRGRIATNKSLSCLRSTRDRLQTVSAQQQRWPFDTI